MKQAALRALAVAATLFAVTTTVTDAQQVPLPTTAAEVPGPASGTTMTKAYVQTVARMAYLWGWPLMNASNRATAFSKAPEPGLLGGVVPVAYNQLAMLTGYISPDQHFHRLPEPGCRLRRWIHRARQGADGDSGAGLQRPLLRLCHV